MTDGIESALEQAQAAAGDRSIGVCASDVVRPFLRAGLLDEIQLSVAPVLLGGGVPLFGALRSGPVRLEQIRATESDGVTHLRYRGSAG